MEVRQLRHRATCDVCGSRLLPRTDAWVDPSGSSVVCVSCHTIGAWTPPPVRMFEEPVAAVAPAERPESDWDATGDDSTDEALSGLVDLTDGSDSDGPDPDGSLPDGTEPSVVSARVGVSGELSSRRVPVEAGTLATTDGSPSLEGLAADLERLRPDGIDVLRGRPWIGAVGTDEHVVVAPSGVWVIDIVPTGRSQALERDFLAGTSGAEILNALGGRVTVVGALIPEDARMTTPVRGMLCFEDEAPDWFEGIFHLAGVTVTDRDHLAEVLFDRLVLDEPARRRTAETLAGRI